MKMKTLKIMLLGSAASGAGVAGLSGIAGIAATSSIIAVADPEPVSKTVMVVVSVIAFALGAFFVYLLVKMLIRKDYCFEIEVSAKDGSCKVQGKPKPC
jgi:Kef-type K+ transport system membrane component KefB